MTSTPAGINCHLVSPAGYPYEHESGDQSVSGPCYADFPVGTVVTVTTTPDAGNYLNGLDCGSGGMLENPCKIGRSMAYVPSSLRGHGTG
jgi:hypothetical protein